MRNFLALAALALTLIGGTVTAATAQQVQANAPAADDKARARSDYKLVDRIGTKHAWQVFLTQYPTGFYADLARAQLSKLESVTEVRAEK